MERQLSLRSGSLFFDEEERLSSEGQLSRRSGSKLLSKEHVPSSTRSRQVSGEDFGELIPAAIAGDWRRAGKYLDKHAMARTAIIQGSGMTILHITSRRGHTDFVLKLLKRLEPSDLGRKDVQGNTALHYIAKVGEVKVAEVMVNMNQELLLSEDNNGNTPLMVATEWGLVGRKKMVEFLARRTVLFLDRQPEKRAFTGDSAVMVIFRITAAGFYDICLYLLRKSENLLEEVLNEPAEEGSLLMVMAEYPSHFQQKSIGFPQLIANWIQVLASYGHEEAAKLDPTRELVAFICLKVKDLVADVHEDPLVEDLLQAVHVAAKNGILVIVEIWLEYFPETLWMLLDDRLLFHVAVEHRQMEIFRYLIQYSGGTIHSVFKQDTKNGNILHLAAMKAPYSRLNSVSGTALQLQSEVQWFQLVEEMAPSNYKLKKWEAKTPRELFTEEHEKLHVDGTEWMKSTSENCMVVAALVAGAVFTSMIQVPGGVDTAGNPNFLKTISFAVFSAATGVALFASMTSLLFFLAILTSSYSEDDFAVSLPGKLARGLFSLFVSVTAMVVAFAAALQIALHSRFKLIYIASAVFGWIPLYFFIIYQVRLCVGIRTIFTKRWWGNFFR